ncbi:MAG: RnfABCDGE type electron transport complex subunit B [Fusobacteriaceae bacterium]
MNGILIPALLLGVTGLVMGLFLAFASKKFEVEVDPKVEAILGVLPGVNCGACGFPGCGGYAEAIALNGAEITSCAPGGAAVVKQIGEIMGVSATVSDNKNVAKLLCNGTCSNTTKKYEYDGSLNTCASLALYSGGNKSCNYSCIGKGDCAVVCPVNAITVNENGLVVIDEVKCVSCGKCVSQCPKKVLAMLPQKKRVTVKCSSLEKGPAAKKACKVACIACGMCEKACPVNAIKVTNNLAKIDANLCVECGLCVAKCPTKAIESKVTETVKASINDKCVGCTMCAKVCPVTAITGALREKHVIDAEKCIGCKLCYQACKPKAIDLIITPIQK